LPDKIEPNQKAVTDFIARWEASGSAERANYTMFMTELCALLGVPGPEPTRPNDRDNAYVFERSVPMDDGDGNTTIGRIDLYKRGCFVLEAKQGSTVTAADELLFAPERNRRGTAVRGTARWDAAMKKAKGQAERYVRSLPASEGNPPLILVVDVGHVIELYSDFSRLGKTYSQFPDARTYRITLKDLAKDETRWLLARVWSDPLGLDPTRHSAKVTREIADKLAKLAKSFESAGHHAEVVAAFLMRCLFTFLRRGRWPHRQGTGRRAAVHRPVENAPRPLRPVRPDGPGRLGLLHRHAAEAQALQRRAVPGIARAAGNAGAIGIAHPGRRERLVGR
jgi:hypothetical protein